uniref:Uncharacterized protein n=1 Tax=Oryza sativa subsp. japonica TaxID=39947 RepID=Q6Z377_ORYSJ|nr:hypothetical protein [Oryza sativa Japonica Group]BAD31240.1 hypothetical protein [Oryza sativa Japonica Group]
MVGMERARRRAGSTRLSVGAEQRQLSATTGVESTGVEQWAAGGATVGERGSGAAAVERGDGRWERRSKAAAACESGSGRLVCWWRSAAPLSCPRTAVVVAGGGCEEVGTGGEEGDWDAGKRSEREETGHHAARSPLVELAVVPTTSSPRLPPPAVALARRRPASEVEAAAARGAADEGRGDQLRRC